MPSTNPRFGDLEFTFQCDQPRSAFRKQAQGDFCNSCQTIVHDFSKLSNEEIIALLKANNQSVCGSVYEDELDMPEEASMRSRSRFQWLFAGFTASLVALTQPIMAQQTKQERIEQTIIYNDQGLPVCPVDLDDEFEEEEHEPDTKPYKLKRYRRKLIHINGRFPFVHILSRRKTRGMFRPRGSGF